MTPQEVKTLGEIAYTAYCENVEYKSVMGVTLPDWTNQRPRLRHAWEIAAAAVAEAVAERFRKAAQ